MSKTHWLSDDIEELLANSWRLDVNGWIFVRAHGDPYHVGFQNGHLLAHEILDAVESLKVFVEGTFKRRWQFFRETSMNQFWPKLPEEYRTEIEGISDGIEASRIVGIGLEDVVALNSYFDLASYDHWLKAKEGRPVSPSGRSEHCSAFIATGKATRNGGIVAAHNTWASYLTGKGYNVILDVSPASGKDFLMQTCPGTISSGTDWYIGKSGLVITETTITGMNTFNPDGTPYFMRSRRAVQYANTIDDWVDIMVEGNNGGYANDWLVGDVKTGEIACLELGTFNHTLERTFDGAIIGSNLATGDRVRSETTLNYDDHSTSHAARRERGKQLIESNGTLLDVDAAKRFLADHVDSASRKETPNRNTLCGHIELDGRGNPEWEMGPSYPGGAFDGKVTDSELVSNGAFWAHWGKPCDTHFCARSFLSQHPEYRWQESRLGDIEVYPWTLFKASSKWEIA